MALEKSRDVFWSPLNGTLIIRFDIGIRCRESHKRQREFLMTLILGPRFLSAMGACCKTRFNVSFSGEPEAHVEQAQSVRRSLREPLPHNRREYGERNHSGPSGKKSSTEHDKSIYIDKESKMISIPRQKVRTQILSESVDKKRVE